MDTWTAIRTKRAIRDFADRPLEADHLERILRAGRHSGSSKNLQRWDFIVCRDREHLGRLAAVGPWAGHLAGAAVAIALVTPDPRAPEAPLSILFDLGQAAENMMLAAWELGIGSVPATVYDEPLARELLAYPEDRHCEFLISFGYPADPDAMTAPPRGQRRRALDEIVHQERWSGPPGGVGRGGVGRGGVGRGGVGRGGVGRGGVSPPTPGRRARRAR